ncbi:MULTISPECIES: NAD(P)H-dependent oxidoreductase [Pseudomonas]|jgi:glutathione-regulated potassium-efflux system ancillary protein KefG|uniref:NAD(P)H-dependent oxidoreductase n=1 Tax=Pseudomonas TaxID=286 RepID=UPI0020C32864|nr:NAD(P)H-dependent oxidoreductase [Pseudomonas fluorescens]MDI9779569.1 NAD(P)H-dependent oxidoreductase [Pseudomonas putida]UTL91675.1 NAD(P)H-dependent oxidoreductase [Pseudomonas fluorescens]
MDNILVVIGHPDLSTSRANAAIVEALRDRAVTLHPLSAALGSDGFDIAAEQKLLCAHERIVLLFPLYWYSCPALMKRWIDEVFTPGFAYARGGDKLQDKEFMVVTSVGAPASGYRAGGFNRFTLDELLRPFQQTVAYVKGRYLPPIPLYESVFIADEALDLAAREIADQITSNQESPDEAYEKLLLKAELAAIALLQQ